MDEAKAKLLWGGEHQTTEITSICALYCIAAIWQGLYFLNRYQNSLRSCHIGNPWGILTAKRQVAKSSPTTHAAVRMEIRLYQSCSSLPHSSNQFLPASSGIASFRKELLLLLCTPDLWFGSAPGQRGICRSCQQLQLQALSTFLILRQLVLSPPPSLLASFLNRQRNFIYWVIS